MLNNSFLLIFAKKLFPLFNGFLNLKHLISCWESKVQRNAMQCPSQGFHLTIQGHCFVLAKNQTTIICMYEPIISTNVKDEYFFITNAQIFTWSTLLIWHISLWICIVLKTDGMNEQMMRRFINSSLDGVVTMMWFVKWLVVKVKF